MRPFLVLVLASFVLSAAVRTGEVADGGAALAALGRPSATSAGAVGGAMSRELQASSSRAPTPSVSGSQTYFLDTHCVDELEGTLQGRNWSTGAVPFPQGAARFVGASGFCDVAAGPQHLYKITLPADAPLGGLLVVDTCRGTDTETWLWVGYGCPARGLTLQLFDCVVGAPGNSPECFSQFLGASQTSVGYVAAYNL